MLQTIESKQRRVANKRAPYQRGEALAIIERTGIDSILDRYANGESLTAIANTLRVSARSLMAYVNQVAHASDYAHARECHAEAWANLGWGSVQMDGEVVDSATVNRARHKEQHCRWRAGIASSRYNEKQAVELSGPNGGPIQAQSIVTVYIPANTRDVVNTVDGETLDK